MSIKTLYVPRGGSRAGYYRCVLPAMYSSQDWAAIDGQPPELGLVSSWVKQSTMEPDFMEYDVVVLEQVKGNKWLGLVKKLRDRGVVVLYEIDDYVHGIRNAPDHDFGSYYRKHDLKAMEVCMRSCDGMIVSTEFLADKYRRFTRDRPIWVCENGLDLGRYRLTRPPERGRLAGRETVTIMWAGATGHKLAALPWIMAVAEVMHNNDHVSFVSIGQDFAAVLHDQFPDRVMTIPFTAMETYPAAMMLGDVAIAPAGDSDWYKAKSTLRAMEAAALGIPCVAHPHYAPAIDHGETGYIVREQRGLVGMLSKLVRDEDLRMTMGARARMKAHVEFNMQNRIEQWTDVMEQVCEGR